MDTFRRMAHKSVREIMSAGGAVVMIGIGLLAAAAALAVFRRRDLIAA